MDITGKIIALLPAQTGNSARGEWKRQDFILETQEQYPRKVCIENWNDKIDLNVFGIGKLVTVSINIESREFNGKWYTGVKGWKAVAAGSENTTAPIQDSFVPPPGDIPPPSDEMETDDLPF